MEESKLKPCPFCGSEVSLSSCDQYDSFEDLYWVKCYECGAEIESYGNESDAIKAWNRRTQSAIIHCADCRWWKHDDDTDPYGYCYACKSGTYTEHWEISIHRKYKGDFYCADAEIREENDYE